MDFHRFSWISMDFHGFSTIFHIPHSQSVPNILASSPFASEPPPIPSGPLRCPKEFTDVFQCFGDTTKADAAFQALKPKKGRSDGNTLFAAAVATSNQSFISKVGEF